MQFCLKIVIALEALALCSCMQLPKHVAVVSSSRLCFFGGFFQGATRRSLQGLLLVPYFWLGIWHVKTIENLDETNLSKLILPNTLLRHTVDPSPSILSFCSFSSLMGSAWCGSLFRCLGCFRHEDFSPMHASFAVQFGSSHAEERRQG